MEKRKMNRLMLADPLDSGRWEHEKEWALNGFLIDKKLRDARIEHEAKKIALSFIQKEYNQRSLIGKLFTKNSYNKAMKELQQ